jgi:GTPase SAR1 family protein
MGPAFYRNAECCALVFDLTEPKSFETIENWRTEFLSQMNPTDPETYPFVLIGNKSDKTEERKVPDSKIKQYCALRGNMPYFEIRRKKMSMWIRPLRKSPHSLSKETKRTRKCNNEINFLRFYDKPKPIVLDKKKDNSSNPGGSDCAVINFLAGVEPDA